MLEREWSALCREQPLGCHRMLHFVALRGGKPLFILNPTASILELPVVLLLLLLFQSFLL